MLISFDTTATRTRTPGRPHRTAIVPEPASTVPLIVLANRAPFRHEHTPDGSFRVVRSASGLVTAIEPLVEAYSGTWIAHGEPGDIQRADSRGGLNVPAARPRYRLRYVGLDQQEYDGFYKGFANEALWPLCHAVHVQPIFRMSDYRHYTSANRRFAAAVCDEGAGRSPLVLVQDYHFALAPAMIRRGLPGSTIVSFWHIPWPHTRVVRMCPWSRALVDGLLGSDVVGLQTDEDCRNFLEAAATIAGCDVNVATGQVRYQGRSVLVRAYPVGVQWDGPALRSLPDASVCRAQLLRDLHLPSGIRLGIGVDRLDYTKGITEKFLAIEHLLGIRPDLRGRFSFVQVAEPSRESLPAYRQARASAVEAAERINATFGAPGHTPIVLLERHFDAPDVHRMYRAADLCFVNSLDDGMNLVAKEFVSARADERGSLLLSEFAGASRQLTAALRANPYAIEQTAHTLAAALEMPVHEQARRMRAMRAVVRSCDSEWWAEQLLGDGLAQREVAAQRSVASATG